MKRYNGANNSYVGWHPGGNYCAGFSGCGPLAPPTGGGDPRWGFCQWSAVPGNACVNYVREVCEEVEP